MMAEDNAMSQEPVNPMGEDHVETREDPVEVATVDQNEANTVLVEAE